MNCGIDHTGIHNQLSQRWLEADKGCFLSPAPPQNDHASFYFCQSSVFLVQDETPSLSFWRFINSRGRHGIAPFLPLWQRNKNIGVEFKWLNVDGTSVWCFLLETRKTDLLRTQKIGLGAKKKQPLFPLYSNIKRVWITFTPSLPSFGLVPFQRSDLKVPLSQWRVVCRGSNDAVHLHCSDNAWKEFVKRRRQTLPLRIYCVLKLRQGDKLLARPPLFLELSGLRGALSQLLLNLLYSSSVYCSGLLCLAPRYPVGSRSQPLPTSLLPTEGPPVFWRGMYESTKLRKAPRSNVLLPLLVGSPSRVGKSFPAVKSWLPPFWQFENVFWTSFAKGPAWVTEKKNVQIEISPCLRSYSFTGSTWCLCYRGRGFPSQWG